MMIHLPAPGVPYKRIELHVTDYNWQNARGEPRKLTKTCSACGRVLPILMFVVREYMARINGKKGAETYLVYADEPQKLCVDCYPCHPSKRDFHLYYVGAKTHIRLDLHDDNGDSLFLVDPKSKKRQPIVQRPVRKMTQKRITDPCVLRLEPYEDRQHDKEGKPYGSRNRSRKEN